MSRVALVAGLALLAAPVAVLAGQRLAEGGTPVTEAPPVPAPLARTLRGLAPVERLTCIRTIDAIEPTGAATTILFRAGRRDYYRNDTDGGCRNLARGDRITTERVTGDRLCNGDVVRTSDRTSGVLTGSCTLGDFIRYAPH